MIIVTIIHVKGGADYEKLSKKEAKNVTGGKKYQCRYCSFSTDSRDVMTMHYKGLHNVTWP